MYRTTRKNQMVGVIKMKIDYKNEYLIYSSKLNDCTTKRDVRIHNAAMRKLGKLYNIVKNEPDKSFFLDLLQDDNERTRMLAAAHCLGLGVYTSKAKRVLTQLSKNNGNPIVAFEAQATLDVWKQQGYLQF